MVESLTEGPRVRASLASLCCGPWTKHIYFSLVLDLSLFNWNQTNKGGSKTNTLFTSCYFFACYCHLLVIFAKSLDPDQARQHVWPDQDPNFLTLRWCSWNFFWKMLNWKYQLKTKKKQVCVSERYPACKELTNCFTAIFQLPGTFRFKWMQSSWINKDHLLNIIFAFENSSRDRDQPVLSLHCCKGTRLKEIVVCVVCIRTL